MTEERNHEIGQMVAQKPWKAIVLFSVPVLLGNLFQQLYNMADIMIVGRFLGLLPLAGVGATSSVTFLIIGFATGLTGGFSVVTAQRAGLGNEEQVKASAAASLELCLIAAAVLTLTGGMASRALLRLMNTPEDIFEYANVYLRVICLGLFASIYYNMMAGLLRAIGDSRTPLYLLFFSAVLNIALDVVVILWFHMGVGGAAFATVFSQLFSAVVCHIYAVKRYPMLRPEWRHFAGIASEAWVHIRIGLPMALQFSVTAVGIMILQAYLNRFGSLVIAGYTAAGKVENLVTQPFIALALTMEVYCGQNFGAGNMERIRQGIRSCLCIGMICAAAAAGINLIFGRSLIGLFLEQYDSRVVEYGYNYLMVIAVFFWLLCGLQIMRSSLQGMGEAAVPMTGGVIELLARWGGCAVMAAPFGVTGVYLSTPLAWGLALLLLVIRYIRCEKTLTSIGGE